MLEKRGVTGKQLAQQVGLSETQMSLFRSGKVRGIRFSTLERLCLALDCRPGDLIDFEA
jgi:putative transcriptional regulator